MADLVSNDNAYEQVESVITRLARTLDFEYTSLSYNGLPPMPWGTGTVSSATLPFPSPPVFGQIYRTLPHAFGLFAVQEDVRICCRTRMRSQLLHEHIKEKLGLDTNTELDVKQGEITLHHEQLIKLQLSLPNGLSLVLSPNGPDVSATLKVELQFENDFRSLFKEQDAPSIQNVLNVYRNHYLSLRMWTCRVGMLSKEYRLLCEHTLSLYYTRLFLEVALDKMVHGHNLTTDIMAGARFVDYVDELSLLPLSSHHLMVIRHVVISRSANSFNDCCAVTVDALNHYLNTYSVFVRLDASCWNTRQQSKLGQHRFIKRIRDLAARIQVAHSKKSSKELCIWPEFLSSSAQTENITILLGRRGDSDKSEEDTLREACQAVLHGDEELLELGSMVEYNIMPREKLREELGDVTIIAQNLPSIWNLHLDFPPLGDPQTRPDAVTEDSKPIISHTSHQMRFRPSHEVLSRMQWDTRHASKRYEVGYVDRFEEELLWKSVEEWTSDAQRDDFVPLHRIRQFREVGTGTVVWDRDLKLDRTSEFGG